MEKGCGRYFITCRGRLGLSLLPGDADALSLPKRAENSRWLF